TKLAWALAGGISTFSQAPIFWAITGKLNVLPLALALTAFLFAFISGVFLAGLLGKVIRDSLIRAGVPVPFSIPKNISPESRA
ncbi:MAG TPA: hypothetical protein VKK79_00060, partial [Candidatus Lokiarchaeia archaeon]|nr:hypothetical protein [Candidatus Lokiarchaeia archaeon]